MEVTCKRRKHGKRGVEDVSYDLDSTTYSRIDKVLSRKSPVSSLLHYFGLTDLVGPNGGSGSYLSYTSVTS